MLLQVDAQKTRFLFMYFGREFDVNFFQGKFELASVEGSSDDRGCHFVFLKTANQIRTSQLQAAINEYNSLVPSSMAMRLQAEVYQPVIVTMISRRMEGSIYSKIVEDKQTRFEGRISNYWFWDPERHGNLSLQQRAGRKLTTPAPDQDSAEFDVVKKRRAMESSSSTPSADDSPEALAAFRAFEDSVLPALRQIHEDEEKNRRLELETLEDCMAKGILMPSTGGVYFAWSECLRCMKIGATRRDDPNIRLRELSRYVTVPFTLAGWIQTPTPFRRESMAHAHFASARIRHAGAGTEFFDIDAATAAEYCSAQ